MSTNNSETSLQKNRRIAKNALFMYIRMFVLMIIALFTARVVYNTLGIDDYGTYNVVGTVIVFFSFLNGGLSAATNRFLTAEIAKGTEESGNKVFNVCLQSHGLIAIIVLVLAETVGLWIVNSVLNIPEGRMFAANVVYQLSIIATVVNLLYAPFNTALLAYEKMSIYAYFSIIEAVNKLVIVYLIQVLPGDKLITYGILVLCVSLCMSALNYTYCFRHFKICHLRKVKDKQLLGSIFKFTSWSLFGKAAVVATNQGVSVLINVFYNVAVNAAMAVSNQITSVVSSFVNNFQIAFRPQIVKSFVNNEKEYLQSLILRSSKISSFLILVFIVPIYVEIHNVLTLWLGDYPQYSVEFCKWTLLAIFFDTITSPLWMTVNAQTQIKNYQLITSLCFSMNFFIGWIVLALGVFPPYCVIIIRTIVFLILVFVRLWYTKKFFADFNVKEWIEYILGRSSIIFIVAFFAVSQIIKYIHLNMIVEVLVVSVIAEMLVIPMSLFFLFSQNERVGLLSMVKGKLHIK